MSMKAVIIVAAGVIVAVTAAVAWNNARGASAAESAFGILERKRTGIDAEIRRMEGRLAGQRGGRKRSDEPAIHARWFEEVRGCRGQIASSCARQKAVR